MGGSDGHSVHFLHSHEQAAHVLVTSHFLGHLMFGDALAFAPSCLALLLVGWE